MKTNTQNDSLGACHVILSKHLLGLLLIIFFVHASRCCCAQDGSAIDSYLRKSITWKCAILNKEVPLKIYYLNDTTGNDEAEVIVYVKNLAWERIGQESDLSILNDDIQNKFIVITVDFGNEPKAVSTFIDSDLHDVFRAVYGTNTPSLLEDVRLKPSKYRCFFMPAGYRVATNLVYWEIDKHGVNGTMEYIMKSYNDFIVPKVSTLKVVSSPRDMVDKNGQPLDFRIKMDIVYPSQAKKKLPVLINSETTEERNPNSGPGAFRPHYIGFTMRGYVHVVMGHCFNPYAGTVRHFPKWELDHQNALACYTAALRYVNMNSDKYGMDPNHIGAIGHSKGQMAVTRLSDPHHVGGAEESEFDGFPKGSPEPQPWPGYPSNIHVGYQAMGAGTYATQFITRDYVPTFYACGGKATPDNSESMREKGFPRFANKLEELDVNHISMMMQGLGHELPYGFDEILGVDRYQLFHDFFDRYLKPEAKLPPVALMITPRDNTEIASSASEITVHFAPIIDKATILDNNAIKIICLSDKTEVKGQWKNSRHSTRFTFKSDQALKIGEQYQIVITTKVKDVSGVPFEAEKSTTFKVR